MRRPRTPILTRSTDSLLAPFHQQQFSGGLADAREQPAPIAVELGHVNGEMAVPGKIGWYWARRKLPSGADVHIRFYAPTDGSGTAVDGLEAGRAATLTRTADTQPTYYKLDAVSQNGNDGWITFNPDPCDFYPGIGFAPPVFGSPEFNAFTALWAQTYPYNQNVPGDVGTNPYHNVTITGGGQTSARNRTIPVLSNVPPTNPAPGTLWTTPEDYNGFRRNGDPVSGAWFSQDGPTSGTFCMRKMKVTVTKGQVVYETGADPFEADLADNSIAACYGKVLGVVMEARNAGQYAVVQVAGDFIYNHGFGTHGQRLYLGTGGNLTATAPADGSGAVWQQVAVVGNISAQGNRYLTIALAEPVMMHG